MQLCFYVHYGYPTPSLAVEAVYVKLKIDTSTLGQL